MKKLLSTIGFILLINACLMSQASIDFEPKALKKELNKISNGSNINMQEIKMSDQQFGNSNRGKFFVLPDSFAVVGLKYVYVGRVNTCRAGVCFKPSNNPEQASEYFDYYILYSANATVRKIKIYNYQSSHGHEVTATSWLKQFINYKGKQSLVLGKNIDAISGATISADATSTDIEDKTKCLLKKINQLAAK